MKITAPSIDIKDDEVFKRLLILEISPALVANTKFNYFTAAQFAADFAKMVISKLDTQ